MSVKLRCPTAPGAGKKNNKQVMNKQPDIRMSRQNPPSWTHTVLVCAYPLGHTARAVSWSGEAQHRRVVLGELLQTRHVAHVDTVLEVGTHCDQGDLAAAAGFPRQELKKRSNRKSATKLRGTRLS